MRLRKQIQVLVFPSISFVIFFAALKMLSEVHVRVGEYQCKFKQTSRAKKFEENSSNTDIFNKVAESLGNVADSQRNCADSISTKNNIK